MKHKHSLRERKKDNLPIEMCLQNVEKCTFSANNKTVIL